MSMSIAPPQPMNQGVVSALISRLKSLVSTTTDRTEIGVTERPYSFLSECECPDDCLRDHENE